jgi:hypothetical protein
MRLFPKGLSPIKIKTIFKFSLLLNFIIQTRGILMLGQKGDLFQLKISITWTSLENFEQPEDHVFVLSKLEQSKYWKRFGLIGNSIESVLGQPACTVQPGKNWSP